MRNRKTTILFSVLLCIIPCITHSQTELGFEFDPTPVVKIGTDTLVHAWGGGMNFVQFSDIDYDYDGQPDLFVFDRSGEEISLFRTVIQNGNPTYEYVYGGSHLFPADVRYRAALLDYNGDGKNDLFTYGIGGVKVYKNTGNAGTGLQWEVASNLLQSDYYGDVTNLYVSSGDIPAFADVEGDGDIDVLTFQIGGERLEYHQNQSMELYGIPDSLIFILKNECWGQFREDINSNAVLLNNTDSPCGPGNGNIDNPLRTTPTGNHPDTLQAPLRHSGSTVLALDADDNGVLDLILGDVSNTNLLLLINGGTQPNTNSPMISQDVNFPSNTTPATMQLFPAAFYVDVDHDGVKDLIVGANARTISQNEKSVTYYENLGTNTLPNFIFRSKSFLQGEMIEHGLGSIPVLFDQNGDGKRDLLIANFFRYKATLSKESTFMVYRNTGSAANPEYSYYEDDFFGLTSQSLGLRAVPAFGDLDGDGDEDMLIGLENGQINKYVNTAGAGNPVAFGAASTLTDNTGATINVVAYAAPQLFDLDNDGLKDLIIGKKTGEIAYYRNTGTLAVPEFTLYNDTLGGVDVALNTPDGYAVPHFFRVNDTTHLFLGAYDGKLHYYNQIDGHLSAPDVFHLVSPNFRNIDVGLYSSFWTEDTDNDGLLNLFAGQDLGGLHHFEAVPGSTVGITPVVSQSHVWKAVPNPATTSVHVYTETPLSENVRITVHTLTGEIVAETTSSGSVFIDVHNYSKGMYIVHIAGLHTAENIRLVVN